jgi:Centrosomal spindle body, CEP44
MEYSQAVSAKIAEMNVEMFGKTDLRFIESVYKVCMFLIYALYILCNQFLSGFKLIMACMPVSNITHQDV